MPRRLSVRATARADLFDQAQFIAEDDVDAAIRFLESARAEFDRLAMMPRIGRPRQFGRAHLRGVRSRPIRGFENVLVFYRPTTDGIDVLRVLHGARDLDALFDDGHS